MPRLQATMPYAHVAIINVLAAAPLCEKPTRVTRCVGVSRWRLFPGESMARRPRSQRNHPLLAGGDIAWRWHQRGTAKGVDEQRDLGTPLRHREDGNAFPAVCLATRARAMNSGKPYGPIKQVLERELEHLVDREGYCLTQRTSGQHAKLCQKHVKRCLSRRRHNERG